MTNTHPTQFTQHVFPAQSSSRNAQRLRSSVRQDNPAPPRARTASPQPAPLKNTMRPPPFDEYKKDTRPGRPGGGKRQHTTTHLKPRVRAELDRKAKEEGLSISATLAAIAEWYFQQSLYEQQTATLDTAIDKAIGRHMRTYSDRNAGLQVRTLMRTELLVVLITNILGRQESITPQILEHILNDADEAARASITRQTPKQKKMVTAEKEYFDGKGVNDSA